MVSINLMVFLLRVAIGVLFAAHGAAMLFGWFGGPGFAGVREMFQHATFKPAWFWASLAGLGQFVGGLLLALGLLTPLGEVAIFACMFMATFKFHWHKGLWVVNGGYEYPLVLLLLSMVFGVIDPGPYSLDAIFQIHLPTALLFGIGIVAAPLVDLVGIIVSRRFASKQEAI